MQGREGQGSLVRAFAFETSLVRERVASTALALVCASAVLLLCASSAIAKGSAQGPPAASTSVPFTQCPNIGADSSCEYLIDVTTAHGSLSAAVKQDATQHFYDGEDDVTVGIQNDTKQLLPSVHIGVNGSKDHLFAFDGDGICSSAISPKPAECPFSERSYDGPDTHLIPESEDAGTVEFLTPLKPGQYTYFALEKPPTGGIVAGEVDDVVSTTLTNTQTRQSGEALGAPAPVPFVDQATIQGTNGATASGTVEYALYSDANCSKLVETLGTKSVLAGVAQASNPSSDKLATNATYYWLATYSGDAHNSDASSTCGSETMTFGSPPAVGPGGGAAGSFSSQFNFVGHARVNERTGQILITVQLPGGGVASADAVVAQGASLARAGNVRAAAAKKAKRCKRGFVRRHGRCTSNSPAPFGASSLTAPAAGTYTITISPNSRILAALKKGKKVFVTISVTFQSRAGGVPVTHTQSALVKLRKPRRKHR
jgi:hypothetical protein